MGPLSNQALVEKLFDALSVLEGFKYSKDELIEFRGMIKPEKSSAKSRLSAFQIYRSTMKGIDKDVIVPWSEIKNNPDEFSKYEKMATDKNNERGFSNEDPKLLKKQKLDERKNALKAAIIAAQQKKTHLLNLVMLWNTAN